jgi:hypothetical protein
LALRALNQGVEWGGVNNYIYGNESTDFIAVATNGTERARIDSAGLVGIGTSAPTEKLTINGNVAFNTNDQFIKFNSFYGSPFTGSMGSILAFNPVYVAEVAAINFYQTGGNAADILFRTGLAGASVERMRINSSGNVGIGTTSPAVACDVVGQVRASTGILFGSDTAAANALDDYEEGTWTPSLGGTATYNEQIGTYTKIGNVVTVSGRIHVNIKGTGSGTIVSGLPFTSAASYPYGIAIGKYLNIASSAFTVYGDLAASSSVFELFCTTAAGTGNYVASVFADSTQITFTFTYRV